MKILNTDGYKFSMGMAGWPLRTENFYLSFKSSGMYYNPLDLKEYVTNLLPNEKISKEDLVFLRNNGYELNVTMQSSLKSMVKINSIPKGSWFFGQEPFLSVSGPSFLVSWLESQLTWINYPIQLATHCILNKGSNETIRVVSNSHKKIVEQILEHLKISERPIEKDEEYFARVLKRVQHILSALRTSDLNRVKEVGMRSAISMDHHQIVLNACKEAGLSQTSNALLAKKLDMDLFGTVGHEHNLRCGSDILSYMNYMDRVPGKVSCLLDTWNTIESGIPASLLIAESSPQREFVFRIDSGDLPSLSHLLMSQIKNKKLKNCSIVLSGGINKEIIDNLEILCDYVRFPHEKVSYLIGGHLTASTLPTRLTRDNVEAVYKISETTGQPVMKMGERSSLPGRPVIWRRLDNENNTHMPVGIIAQEDEQNTNIYSNYVNLSEVENVDEFFIGEKYLNNFKGNKQIILSPETAALKSNYAAHAINAYRR